MKVVVGLGNPGPRYRDTRHNLGFRLVEELARRQGWRFRLTPWWRSAQGTMAGTEVTVAQPLTFMNDSGRAVAGLLTELEVGLEELLVVCDDLNLARGQMRLRRRGSSGGHKGLASIAEHLRSEEFARLRLGIGAPRGDRVEFVLSDFEPGERFAVEQAVSQAAEAARCWVGEGIGEAMNRFNRKPPQPQGETREAL